MNFLKQNLFSYFFFPGSLPWILSLFAMLALASVLGAVSPHLIKDIFSTYGKSSFSTSLQLFFTLLVLQYLNQLCYQLVIHHYVTDLTLYVRSHAYQKWMSVHDIRKESKVYKEFPLGEILSRIMHDTESFRELVISGSFTALIDALFVISALISFFFLEHTFGLILCLCGLFTMLVLFYGAKILSSKSLKVKKAQVQLTAALTDIFSGLPTLFFNTHERYAMKRTEEAMEDYLQKEQRADLLEAAHYGLSDSLFPTYIFFLVLSIPLLELKVVALLGVILDLLQRSLGPLKSLAYKLTSFQLGLLGLQRIDEFLKHLDEVEEGVCLVEGEMALLRRFEKVEVNIPFFQYPTQEGRSFTLENIHFEGKKGELIGIVGPSGSGKSTLLNILAANIIPDRISIDLYTEERLPLTINGAIGQDVAFYKEQIGLVSQKSVIFTGTLCFNITLDRHITTTTIAFWDFWQYMVYHIPYLERLGLTPHDFITPQTLSAGQIQLVALLRAFFHKRPIILFDEISSALDPELEASLDRLLAILRQHGLTVIVGHRPQTLQKVDRVISLHQGKMHPEKTSGHHLLL